MQFAVSKLFLQVFFFFLGLLVFCIGWIRPM